MIRRDAIKALLLAPAAAWGAVRAFVGDESTVPSFPKTTVRHENRTVAYALCRVAASEVLQQMRSSMVLGNLVNRSYVDVEASAGDVVDVKVPRILTSHTWGSYEPHPILTGYWVEARERTRQAMADRVVGIPLRYHLEFKFVVPDVPAALARPELLQTFARPAAAALAEGVDSAVISAVSGFPELPFDPGQEYPMEDVKAVMHYSLAPPLAAKVAVVDGERYSALRMRPEFVEYSSTVAPEPLLKHWEKVGEEPWPSRTFGRLDSVWIFRTPLLWGKGGLAFVRDAVGMVVRKVPETPGEACAYASCSDLCVRASMEYRPSTISQRFSVQVLFGVGVLRPNFGVWLV